MLVSTGYVEQNWEIGVEYGGEKNILYATAFNFLFRSYRTKFPRGITTVS
jgi:hypothetical protein